MSFSNLTPRPTDSISDWVAAGAFRLPACLALFSGVRVSVLVLLLGLLFGPRSPGHARTLVIDDRAGARYDAVLDGFPGIAEFDGNPDLAGNLPNVALKLGVVEARTMAEFPLHGVPPRNVRRAVLEWNIDDVISTFGPGTSFSGRAARLLLVHPYRGDGVIELADFNATASEPWTVSTESFGTITDQTLARTGPLVFTVNVTPTLNAYLSTGADWFGVVFRTTDNNTATSIDNLGDQPGHGGDVEPLPNAFLPRLVIELDDPPPTATLPIPPSPTPSPTATATVTPTFSEPPTPTVPIPASCPGDCNGDQLVTVDEVIQLVRIALELAEATLCLAGDRDQDATVTIDEILQAVTALLSGCSDAAPL